MISTKEIARRLTGIHYLVEATDFEQLALWRQYHEGGLLVWQQLQDGFWITIGHLNRRPIVLSFSFAQVGGRKIAFYDSCSELVDNRMIETWLTKHLPGVPQTNAMNFHQAV